jgi:peptidoglycan/xylan/chitin deacetylase (PgdA/CDA1 family)
VTFSYDDGSRADLRLAEILDKNGLKGTFNINSGMQTEWHMTDPEMLDLLNRGHEIALHGRIHRAPCLARPIDTIRDVLECKEELERRFERIIRGYAYPDSGITKFINGMQYSDIKAQLTTLGVTYARTLAGDNNNFNIPNDLHAWMPNAHHNNPQIFDWVEQFIGMDNIDNRYEGDRFPRLLYIWGHSSEFDRDNNWDRIEKITKTIGCAEGIWAATNIEIADYINAFRSLVSSASGDRIYNPTLITLYFVADGKSYKIAPGEEIVIK